MLVDKRTGSKVKIGDRVEDRIGNFFFIQHIQPPSREGTSAKLSLQGVLGQRYATNFRHLEWRDDEIQEDDLKNDRD